MRLINATTMELEGPFTDYQAPPYAILSHTWGDDEMSLQEFADSTARCGNREGFKKIREACAQALRDDLFHVWVDTVCIDKTSSAELSEAINSMYNWYAGAHVCYVYLQDLGSTSGDDLQGCRWFTRGWTLQELLAPSSRSMTFFNSTWDSIGTKRDLVEQISTATEISVGCINGECGIRSYSIADRMSWASRRSTTRPEDIAYCLLGIFDVNMPLLYGEGQERAFYRLQQEILRTSSDQTIFVWSNHLSGGGLSSSIDNALASSPSCFNSHTSYEVARSLNDTYGYSISGQGVTLRTRSNRPQTRILLKCRRSGVYGLCALSVTRLRTGQNDFVRQSAAVAEDISPDGLHEFTDDITLTLRTDLMSTYRFEDENHLHYLIIVREPSQESGYFLADKGGFLSEDSPRTIAISPVANMTPEGAVLSFHGRDPTMTPFFVALICERSTGDKNRHPWMESDFIGVYDNPLRLSARPFYRELVSHLHDGRIPDPKRYRAALRGVRNGLDIWTLGGGELVHVGVTRNVDSILGHVGCARILAGASWDSHIRHIPVDWGPLTPSVSDQNLSSAELGHS